MVNGRVFIPNWDESCSVKIACFDDDHKQMFSIINRLHNAMLSSKGALVVPEIVTELIDHAQGHFSGEEAMMEKAKFPELASHRLEHEILLRQLEQFQQIIAAGKFVSSVTVAEFLDKSMMPHTKQTDQKYSEHLNANGIF